MEDDEYAYAGPVSLRFKLGIALVALLVLGGIALEELEGLGDVAGTPGPAKLHGTWRLATLRGRPPAEAGIERALLTFGPGGELHCAFGASASANAGGLPHLVEGRWKLAGEQLAYALDTDESSWTDLTWIEGRIRLDPDPSALHFLGSRAPGIYTPVASTSR